MNKFPKIKIVNYVGINFSTINIIIDDNTQFTEEKHPHYR